MNTDVLIYCDLDCADSRAVLALLRRIGLEPLVVSHDDRLSRDFLGALMEATGEPIHSLLRRSSPRYMELGLGDEDWSDEALLDIVVAQPVLLEGPIVMTAAGAKVCRSPETLATVLTAEQAADLAAALRCRVGRETRT